MDQYGSVHLPGILFSWLPCHLKNRTWFWLGSLRHGKGFSSSSFLTVDYRISVVWNMLGSEIQSFQYTCEFLVTGGGCETDVGVTGRHQPLSEWGELSLSYPLLLSVWVGLSFFPHDCLNKDVLFIFYSDFVWMGFTFISHALHVRVLTLSLPHWPCCHLKTANKVQHLKSEKWFRFHTSMSKELHLNAQYWSSLKYGTGKSSVCRHVCTLFCWKILLGGAVKGLIDNFQKWQVKIIWQCFDCGRVKSPEWRRQRRRADLQWF